jgi:hypothetical protein
MGDGGEGHGFEVRIADYEGNFSYRLAYLGAWEDESLQRRFSAPCHGQGKGLDKLNDQAIASDFFLIDKSKP